MKKWYNFILTEKNINNEFMFYLIKSNFMFCLERKNAIYFDLKIYGNREKICKFLKGLTGTNFNFNAVIQEL